MENVMYKKVVKEDGTVEFVEVPAVQQETKPAGTKTEAKTFGQVMGDFWTWLRPRLSGGVIGAVGMFALTWFMGRGTGEVPQIPSAGGSSGDSSTINF